MKNLLVFISVLMFSSAGMSQIQDLSELAEGEFLDFRAIYDRDDDLFGYIVSYSKDEVDKKTQLMNVVLLDKNLNEFLSVEFDEHNSVQGYIAYFHNSLELILYPLAEEPSSKRRAKHFIYPSSRLLNLKTKELRSYAHTCFEEGELIDCPNDRTKKEIEKENKKNYFIKKNVPDYKLWKLDNGSFLACSWRERLYKGLQASYYEDYSFTLYSEDRKELWNYNVKPDATKKDYASVSIVSVDDDEIYFIKTLWKKGKRISRAIIGLDVTNGKIVLEEDMSSIKGVIGLYASLPFSTRSIGTKVLATGIRRNKSSNQIGYYQFIINKEKHDVEWRSFLFNELKSDLKKVDEYANVEKGFYLRLKAVYASESGATVILTEKYKFKVGTFTANKPKTRDFVVMIFDEDFKKTDVQLIEKDKSVGSFTDLLFSQYLNDQKDYVFFYRDYRKDDVTKDKNWVLGINSVIDGTFKNEEIPMSSDDFFIYPYVAKEGHILLREFNRKSEHNQIRLERLNL